MLGVRRQNACVLFWGIIWRKRTGDKRAFEFSRQRISIALQRGNACSIQGTFPLARGLDEVFYILKVQNLCVFVVFLLFLYTFVSLNGSINYRDNSTFVSDIQSGADQRAFQETFGSLQTRLEHGADMVIPLFYRQFKPHEQNFKFNELASINHQLKSAAATRRQISRSRHVLSVLPPLIKQLSALSPNRKCCWICFFFHINHNRRVHQEPLFLCFRLN